MNVHYFRDADRQGPIEVTAVVRVKESANAPSKQILAREKLLLTTPGQERTIFRFKLTEKGKLVEGSVHDLPKPLRSQNPRQARRR